MEFTHQDVEQFIEFIQTKCALNQVRATTGRMVPNIIPCELSWIGQVPQLDPNESLNLGSDILWKFNEILLQAWLGCMLLDTELMTDGVLDREFLRIIYNNPCRSNLIAGQCPLTVSMKYRSTNESDSPYFAFTCSDDEPDLDAFFYVVPVAWYDSNRNSPLFMQFCAIFDVMNDNGEFMTMGLGSCEHVDFSDVFEKVKTFQYTGDLA